MRKKTNRNKSFNAADTVVLILTLFLAGCDAGLRGVGLYESSDFNGINVSMAGGGYLNIASADLGFDGYARQNVLAFTTNDLGTPNMEISLPILSENDQYMSAPTSNRLVYTTPSITSLFNGLSLSAFEGQDISMTLKTTTSTTGTVLECSNKSKCLVKYSWQYTPVIYYLIPSIVYPGMNQTIAINPKSATNYKSDTGMAVDIRIDGTSLNFTDYDEDMNLSKNNYQFIAGMVKTAQRNATSELTAFFRGAGYAMNDTSTIETCLYDGITCYRLKVFPTVSAISDNDGSSKGGQELTITGTSLDGATVRVTVDGLPCDVKSIGTEQIVCTTTAKVIDPLAVAPVSYIGSQGLTRYFFGNRNSIHDTWRTDIEDAVDRMIYPNLDWSTGKDPSYRYTQTFQAFDGFFKAPETAKYRFIMSCDDNCSFKISLGDKLDPADATKLMYNGQWTSYRNSNVDDKTIENKWYQQRFSDWVDLVKDEYYYVESTTYNGGSQGNLDVGMEIRPDVMPEDHVQLETQVQKMSIGQTNLLWDTMQITVIEPDQGQFMLAMLKTVANKEGQFEFWRSGEIVAGCTADELRSQIKTFYKSQYGVDPLVTVVYQDITGTEVLEDDTDNIHSLVYSIEVPTPLNAPSVETIQMLPISTTSTVNIAYPTDVQLSSPPITGKFWVQCHNTDGETYATRDMDFGANANHFKNVLEADCSFLAGKIEVTQLTTTFASKTIGVEYKVGFTGVKSELNQYKIIQSSEEPPVGIDIVTDQSVVRPFGTSLVWQVIPGDYFYTRESKPQVIVQVDDMLAMCTGLACDYDYFEEESVIEGFVKSGLQLTITGQNLGEPNTIEMGQIDCSNIVLARTFDSITCDLSSELPGGSWYPIIIGDCGQVKLDDTISPEVVEMTLISVSPKININPAGGDIMTITGTNFPRSNDSRYKFSIILSVNTRCVPSEVTETQIICETEPFTSSRRRMLSADPFDLTVSLVSDDGVVEVTDSDLMLNSNPITATGITPSEISPIAFKTIEIQLYADYPTAGMTIEDFTVTLVPEELELSYLFVNNDGVRELNVVAVDTVALTITVKYGGAYSGLYDVVVKSITNGNVDTEAFQLKAVFEITNIVPLTGSIYGGSKITIYGGPFTDDLKENIVKVGYKWWEGIDHYCYIIEIISENELTCRLPLDLNREAREYQVIAFASTYEESNCEFEDCLFTFIAASELPSVTGVAEAAFDEESEEYWICIPVQDNTDSNADIDFELNGVLQSIVSADSTEIIIQVDTTTRGLFTNTMNLYLSVGLPEGYTNLLSGISFEPKLLSLSTQKGSSAGSLITAVVKGVGIYDKVTLWDSDSNVDICQNSRVKEYGVLECQTIAQEYASLFELSVKDLDSGEVFACAAIDVSDCQYQTYDSVTEQMSVSVVAVDQVTDLRFSGTNFPSQICEGIFLGLVSDSCVVSSDTQVVATFDTGVPTSSEDVTPELRFKAASGTHYALTAAVVQNPLSVVSTTSGVVSSFAGGRTLEITANGLTSDIILNKSKIRVCQKNCLIDTAQSTSSVFACSTPAISTTKSNSEFTIQEESNLNEEELIYNGITNEMAERTVDGGILPAISGSSANCYVGIKFPTNYVGVLNEISFFLDEFNQDKIVDYLTIEASTDNFVESIELLVEVSEEAHEGWNYYDLTEFAQPKYQYYRLKSTLQSNGGCDSIGEIRYFGFEVIDDDNLTYECDISLVETATSQSGRITGETETDLGEVVSYSTTQTPTVDDISPRWGAVSGNTPITFTGRNFNSADIADYKVKIDDVDCPVTYVSSTEIKCTTAARIGVWEQDPKLEIQVANAGQVALQGNFYRYCALWSEESTWGDLLTPIDGESVVVPNGLCLLVDIQNSPLLRLVQVDGGALIFPSHDDDPSYHATFDARYIMINNATMEIGTEKHPYKSKLTITMYGEKYDPPMPIFGKKSIGVSFGTLDIHGAQKKSWTDLDSTVQPGETQLTLVEDVDWEIGDHIMITSTDYNMYQAEFVNIVANDIVDGKSTLTIDTAFKHKHYAGVETHGDDTLTIRAEVCLMSRNIVYRGDPGTSAKNQFGAHIMLHSPGDESVIGRIENLQLNDVGQAFLLGKYPIHFHMIGRVTKSYVRNNAIMRSYNRGTTLHGVKYLRVERNCYWDVMGHTIFVEDGGETKNLIQYNVVAGTRPSFSLLGTDQTPGCFWITHPDNIFVGNRAAGSSNYGYWMDYQDTAMGPSFDPNIKPTQSKLGEFRNNVAHSVGNYGLRIFHGHQPPIEAVYEDHLSYRCGKNGVMGGDLGLVVFRNITVADNANSGIEFERITLSPSLINTCRAEDLVIIGRSNGNPGRSTHGIVAPQSDDWLVTNARFYNFQNGAAALGDCAHCDTPKADSGCRTTRFSNLMFDDATVDARIKWRWPFKGIFHDLDGTLTEQGADSYVSAYWLHNDHEECTVDMEIYDGIICPSPFAIQRIAFNAAKGNIFGANQYIWQYDNDIKRDMDAEALESYLVAENGSNVPMLIKARPKNHWTAPYVTRHTYYTRFHYGLDFENVSLEIIPYIWEQDDQSVYFVTPFVETREAIHFQASGDGGLQSNLTMIETSEPDRTMGMNYVYNDTETREMGFVVNGRDGSSSLKITGYRCLDYCKGIDDVEENDDQEVSLWSDPKSWKDLPDRIPLEGEEVDIPDGYDIIYDIGVSPVFKNVEINGKLSFLPGQPAVLQTYSLWVRAGEMNVGTEEEPFDSTVEIRLHGNNRSPSEFVFAPSIPAGNKNLIVTGTVNMFGTPRTRMTRLLDSAYPNQDQLMVTPGLDWANGDKLGLPATNIDPHNSETVIVESYDTNSGLVKLTEPLKGYHFGASKSTGEDYDGIDMRGEVLVLSSNVNITASTDENSITKAYPQPFGCQILVSDFFDPGADFVYRTGSIHFDNVAVYNCSQEHTEYAGIRFELAVQGTKKVSNSAISTGLGQGIIIKKSQNVVLENNVVHDFIKVGIHSMGSSALTITGNVVNGVRPSGQPIQQYPNYTKWTFVHGVIEMDTGSKNYVVKDNIVASGWASGVRLPAYKCGESATNTGNVAHSIAGYGLIVHVGAGACSEFSDFKAYKIRMGAIHMGGSLGSAKNYLHSVVTVDSSSGIMAFGAGGGHIEVADSTIYGSQNMKNLDCLDGQKCSQCLDRKGIWIPTFGGHTTQTLLAPFKLSKHYKAGGGWGGTSLFRNLKFIGFDSKTNHCGSKQYAITTNNAHSDYHPIAEFRGIKFINTDESAMFGLGSPSAGWANLNDCGTFTCTGLYNVLARMEQVSYSGIPMAFGLPSKFQVTGNNKESISSQDVDTCVLKQDWNAYMCQNEHLGVLLFESQDADRMDRNTQPLYVMDMDREFNNRLNAYMDNCWDGAYTCQKREQRFPTIIELDRNYTIEYTGTPPQKQKFELYGNSISKGTLITIRYPDAGAYKVYDRNKELAIPTDWDYDIETWGVPSGKYCGENRYVGVKNFLQFWIEPGCVLYIVPRDAIMLAIRLEWTVKEFFQADSIGKFTDRMAAVLGIAKADLKVVQVYEGSVIVEFQVTAADDSADALESLKNVETLFETSVATLGDSLGAPVMQIVTSDGKVIPMEGYEDLTDFQDRQAQNYATLIEQFQAEQQAIKDSWVKIEDVLETATEEEDIIKDQEPESTEEPIEDDDTNSTEPTSSQESDEDDEPIFAPEELPRDEQEDSNEDKEPQQLAEKNVVIVKTQEITTQVITREQEASEDDITSIFLVVIVVVLFALIFILAAYCIFKKLQRPEKPIQIPGTDRQGDSGQEGKDGDDTDGFQERQFNPEKSSAGLDFLNRPKKRTNLSTNGRSQASNHSGSHSQNSSRKLNEKNFDNTDAMDIQEIQAAVKISNKVMPTKIETVDLVDDFMEVTEKNQKRVGIKVAKKKDKKTTQQMGTVGSRIDTGLKKAKKPPKPVTVDAKPNIAVENPITVKKMDENVEHMTPTHNFYEARREDSARDSSVANTVQNLPSNQ